MHPEHLLELTGRGVQQAAIGARWPVERALLVSGHDADVKHRLGALLTGRNVRAGTHRSAGLAIG